MLYCSKCRVHVTGEKKHCPLCQGDLTGSIEKQTEVFPKIEPFFRLEYRILSWILFATICIAAVCIAINFCFPSGGSWSIFVIMGMVSLWITISILMKKRSNIPKTILWQVGIISLLAVFWERVTGSFGWALDYVFPILCTCAMAAMSIVARIMKLRIEDYMIYLLLDILFGAICFILLVRGSLTVLYPSAICVAASIISFAALFVFERKTLTSEIIRRIHL